MRNLVKYPITTEELVRCLEFLAAEHDPRKTGAVGDMTPLLLETAVAVVQAADEVLKAVDHRLEDEREQHLKYVTPWGALADLVKAFNVCNPGFSKGTGQARERGRQWSKSR